MNDQDYLVRRYERALIIAVETLGLYAAPDSYHAIAVMCDPPSGWFGEDFSFVAQYRRRMPGRAARRAISKIRGIVSPNEKVLPTRKVSDERLLPRLRQHKTNDT
jgi:hypothetical protein